jgi:two-component system, cell cycle sensor histidine kinase and response regulator CckA
MATEQSTCVLIVDDEESLLQLMERFLSSLGYAVEASRSAESAWSVFSQDPGRFSAAIIDLTLPGASGSDLVRKTLEAAPQLKVLICSGYPADLESFTPKQRGRISFLHKPFLPKMLAEAVADLTGGPGVTS